MTLLSLDHITKRFGGLTAVNRVSFSVDEGQVVGLIGPNGAGKTTVFNLITGNYRPDEGIVLFQEQAIGGLSPHRIVMLGIARTFQTIRLFQNMSVVENVLAGCHCRQGRSVDQRRAAASPARAPAAHSRAWCPSSTACSACRSPSSTTPRSTPASTC